MKDIIKGELNMTGPVEIIPEVVAKKWNHLWWISQWQNDYRLIKYVRKDSGMTELKMTISETQAKRLIEDIGLTNYQGPFRSSSSWRKESDVIKLDEWRRKRYSKATI